MKKITQDEFNNILKDHKNWLSGAYGGIRADLSETDLRGAYLSEADLRGAYLSGANLSETDLRGAYLIGADLSEADLRRADLSEADLRGAYLSEADLRGAYLSGAYLSEADLRGAYLSEADLRRADIRGADLSDADLRGADLSGANLSETDLSETDLRGADLNYPIACPEEGSFVAFKKCRDNTIVKLLIPEDAKRCSATSRKCRCNKAIVLSIEDTNGHIMELDRVASKHDQTFIYRVGETASVCDFDENRWNECAPGIHFFITREEAINYN